MTESSRGSITQAVILAGGRGERLRPLTDDTPKPMIDIHGKPFLFYLCEQLAKNGITGILILCGYKGEQIVRWADSKPLEDRVKIRCIESPEALNTGARLQDASEHLQERFFLMYGDNYAAIFLDKIRQLHQSGSQDISLLVHPKKKGNISLDDENNVARYSSARDRTECNWVELGYMAVERDAALKQLHGMDNPSFSSVIEKLALNKSAKAHRYLGKYHSISDIERLELTREYLSKKKLLLLDRDGTINERAAVGKYITAAEDFRVLPGTIEGLKKLAEAGWSFVVISNQAGLATGDLSWDQLNEVHRKLREVFTHAGASLLDVIVCGDHWQDKDSFRRKPNPGMLFEASERFHLPLDQAFYVGDDVRDLEAAERANTHGIFLGDASEIDGGRLTHPPVYSGTTLLDVATFLLDPK